MNIHELRALVRYIEERSDTIFAVPTTVRRVRRAKHAAFAADDDTRVMEARITVQMSERSHWESTLAFSADRDGTMRIYEESFATV